MGKCKSDKCDDCNVPENVEHIITGCKNNNSERRILQDICVGTIMEFEGDFGGR